MSAESPSGRSEAIVYVVDDDLSVPEGLERLLYAARWQVETFAPADKRCFSEFGGQEFERSGTREGKLKINDRSAWIAFSRHERSQGNLTLAGSIVRTTGLFSP